MLHLAQFIEHTRLAPQTKIENIYTLCDEAIQYQFPVVCMSPYFVAKAHRYLSQQNAQTQLATVVGFPMGYNHTTSKIEDIKKSIDNGAKDIDAVINLSALMGDDWNYLHKEIMNIADTCRLYGVNSKIIIETAYLQTTHYHKLAQICIEAQVDYVKTSTGFAPTGATVEAVKLLSQLLPEQIQIKASGGIKTKAFAIELLKAGANRLGTSSGIAIVS